MKFAIIPLLLLVLLAGCASDTDLAQIPATVGTPTGPSMHSPIDIVEVGDKLEIYVLEDESFNGVYMVRDGGHVIFPKVGRVQVAGLPLGSAEASIKKAFETNQLRIATVILERHGSKAPVADGKPATVTIYLSGSVNRPGPLAVPFIDGQQPTAYQAIVHGGGPADFAKLSKTYIVRNTGAGRTRIDVNLQDIGKGKSQDIPIQNGDIIVVPARGLF